MMYDDTISAISTPLGEGGIGIVRMSGPQAIAIAEGIFLSAHGISLQEAKSHTLHYGTIVSQGREIDEVLVTVMHSPRTYTRENIVEINCHGGIVALRTVLDLTLRKGARLAERGEFTKRAFLNGRISLDQAKSVLDIVKAKTRLGLEAAVDQLHGRFSQGIASIRDTIAELLAEIDAGIDFPDQVGQIGQILPRLVKVIDYTYNLLRQAEQGKIVTDGLTITLAGRPNVGKSTLFNALLAEERAIVTPIPGTTRDTVEEEAAISGVLFHIIDTAGLCEPTGQIEEQGVKRAELAISRADLVLLLLDGSSPLTSEDHALLETNWGKPALVVINKSDLPCRIQQTIPGTAKNTYKISAKNGEGIKQLSHGIVSLLLGGHIPSKQTILLLDVWEQDLLLRVNNLLNNAVGALKNAQSPDMVAEQLRSAHKVAGELQGIDLSEDVLNHIFARFCIGK